MDDQSPPEPDDLPEDLISLVKPELQPGERLLWASKAGVGTTQPPHRPSLGALIWFFGFATVCLTCLVVLPWNGDKRLEGAGAGILILGLISLVISFFFVIGFVASVTGRRTARRKLEGEVYALTDQRAIIWVPAEMSAVSVHTFQRRTIKGPDLHRVQYPNGSGDVLFRYTYRAPSGFLGIAEVRRVEELVRRFLVVAEPLNDRFDDASDVFLKGHP